MNKILTVNSLANNSKSRAKQSASPLIESKSKIRELTLSITNICNLRCMGCGFNIPEQAVPLSGNGIDQHIDALHILKSLGLSVGKIVITGGEASLSSSLDSYLAQIKAVNIADEIELVTNGLYPQGITQSVLTKIDSLVISDYIRSDSFSLLWKQYLACMTYRGERSFRRKDAWDDLLGETNNSKLATTNHWATCFYRSYDVTLEQGRLFSCSRIAKKKWYQQGLVLGANTSKESVINYLLSERPKDACYSCMTVGSESTIPVAKQVDTDLDKIRRKAEKYLDKVVNDEK